MTEYRHVQTFGFGFRAFKKFPELIPLFGIIGVAVVGTCTFCFYAATTKPDVRINKMKKEAPHEEVKPTESRKLINLNQKYTTIPELEQLRKEIGSYKS